MTVFADCRESRDLAGRRTSHAGRGCGGVYLTCLLALLGLRGVESAAVAERRAALFSLAMCPEPALINSSNLRACYGYR